MLKLPRPVLYHAPEAVARLVALSLLKDGRSALRRLGKGKDPEALHDFRVALRRLRSCLRAYWSHVKGSVPRKLLNRIRDLARETALGRDAEVEIALLSSFEEVLPATHGPVLEWLLEELERRKQDAYDRVLRKVRQAFHRIEKSLGRKLSACKLRLLGVDPSELVGFADVTRALIVEQAAELAGGLVKIRPDDEALQHEVRIQTKRLRYLLEPVVDEAPGGPPLIEALKEIQDLLGDLRDGKVVLDELESAGKAIAGLEPAGGAARSRARAAGRVRRESRGSRLRSGLDALRRLVKQRERKLVKRLQARWLQAGAAGLREDLEEFARRLCRRAASERDDRERRRDEAGAGQGIEVERKFLLKGLPAAARRAECEEIEQGWIPSKLIQERVRRTRIGKRVRYHRTFKAGVGLTRIEFEEKISKRLFDALWRLTEGRRVRKQRYRVKDGGLVWEIDSFLDRDLVVAEVELSGEDAEVKLPVWLKRRLVREVTGEPAFYNVNLASEG